MLQEALYRTLIRNEIERRISKNPRYSLRAFAKAVGVSAGNLSGILSGKKSLSTKTTERLLEQLELSPEDRQAFVSSLLDSKTHLRRKPKSLIALNTQLSAGLRRRKSGETLRILDRDAFSVISEWHYYAILELCEIDGFRVDSSNISKRLGISPLEATMAFKRLTQMGLIEIRQGRPRKSSQSLSTQDLSKTSIWHRKRQKQILDKSIASLENDPIEMRCHRSLTFPFSRKQIGQLKSKIEEFIWEIASLNENMDLDEVYELHIGLIPLSKFDEPSKKSKKL